MTDISRISRNYYLGFNLPIHLACILGLIFLNYSFVNLLIGTFLFYTLIFGIGVNVGYHRLATHNSFVPKYAWTRYLMIFMGLFAMMGGPIVWAQYHRYHHAFTDTDKDPHSPIKGKWYAHFLWTLNPPSVPAIIVKDLIKDKLLGWMNLHCRSIVIITLLIVFLLNQTAGLALLLAMVMSFNIEMGINSLFGHDSKGSKNTMALQYITFGASLHKNHHINPKNYNFAVAPGEVDLVKYFIDWIKK